MQIFQLIYHALSEYTSVVPINIDYTTRHKLGSQLLLCEFLDESLFLEPLLLLIHLLLDNFLPKREIQITITILTCGFICSSVCVLYVIIVQCECILCMKLSRKQKKLCEVIQSSPIYRVGYKLIEKTTSYHIYHNHRFSSLNDVI